MSVLMVDTEVYNYVRAGIVKGVYNRTVNEFYFYSLRKHFEDKDIEKEALRIVRSWSDMNEQSYCDRYGDKHEKISRFITPSFVKKPLEAIQFIKYLQSIKYNIEVPENEDTKLLNNLINDAMSAYIGNLDQYKAAEWSN